MSKPKSSSSSNPWEALFSSATRPQAVFSCEDAGPASSLAGGYTILIQHSMTPKSQRECALASSMAMAREEPRSKGSSSLSSSVASMTLNAPSSAGRRTLQEGSSWYGMAGPFLVRQAFEELCERCHGAVVFVSTLGTSGVLDFDELDKPKVNDGIYNVANYSAGRDDGVDHHEDLHNNKQVLRKRIHALQMFRQNGACVDLSSNPFGWEDDDAENDACNSFVQRSSMNKLQPIAMSIRRAAANIQARRPSLQEQEQSGKKQQTMQQPIPIVFETLTPLLHIHGVEKISLLLKSLGRVAPSTMKSSGIHPVLSPIIAPILYESISPSKHRCLEDVADAMVHLNLVDAPEGTSLPSFNDPDSSAVISGVMDLVRRGGGGGGGLKGKLIRHCVPFHIMRALSTKTNNGRESCYWVMDNENGDTNNEVKKNKTPSNDLSTDSTSAAVGPAATNAPARPRIYLEDDDPEFDDYDEEDDLDDDLDI